MHTIYARNVSEALPRGLQYLRDNGQEEPSRNGPVLVSPVPVTTVYDKPKEHVLFSGVRNANPFFHLLEALWMLGGRNDVAFPAKYAAQLQLYSDDNVTLNGAYGFRWREHFGYDQLAVIIKELRANPASRRCVLAMWDADESRSGLGYEGDLKRSVKGGKDVPCNTHAYFRLNNGKLELTVCNRSNDAVWGAYGANAVHFSIMQEYVASCVGVPLGRYYQVANNFHIYTEREDVQRLLTSGLGAELDNRYEALRPPATVPLMNTRSETWDRELSEWLMEPARPASYDNNFFNMATVMARAHTSYKAGDLEGAIAGLTHARADWTVAGLEWLQRIAATRALKGQA